MNRQRRDRRIERTRNRQRVHLTYTVDGSTGPDALELPLVIGVIADYSSGRIEDGRPLNERAFIEVTARRLDGFLSSCAPLVELVVSDFIAQANGEPAQERRLLLEFKAMADFRPERIAERVEWIRPAWIERQLVAAIRARIAAREAAVTDLPRQGTVVADGTMEQSIRATVAELDQTDRPDIEAAAKRLAASLTDDVDPHLATRLAALDALMTQQVDEILKHPDFRTIEARWLALAGLLEQARGLDDVRIKVLDLSFDEFRNDLTTTVNQELFATLFNRPDDADAVTDSTLRIARDLTKSLLYEQIYRREAGQFGGEPIAALVADYPLEMETINLQLLIAAGFICEASYTPLLANIQPSFLGIKDFNTLGQDKFDIDSVFHDQNFAKKWQGLRRAPGAHYIGLCAPRIVCRDRYTYKNCATSWLYQEALLSDPGGGLPMAGAAYAVAERIIAAFERYGWYTAITGLERNNGVVTFPQSSVLKADGLPIAYQPPVDVRLFDTHERALTENGIIALTTPPVLAAPTLFDLPSAALPAHPGADTSLSTTLSACRIAHYVRALMRERAGAVKSAIEWTMILNQWLAQYVTDMLDPPPDERARRPLSYGRVEVIERRYELGQFDAAIEVRPHPTATQVTGHVSLRNRIADAQETAA